MKKCSFEELAALVGLGKEVTSELLVLESDIVNTYIVVITDSCLRKYHKIEEKLFQLEEKKSDLTSETIVDYENLRNEYIQEREKYNNANTETIPFATDNLQEMIDQLRDASPHQLGELKNLHKVAKNLCKRSNSIQVPATVTPVKQKPIVQKFNDVVDQMLFEYRERRGNGLIIQKIS